MNPHSTILLRILNYWAQSQLVRICFFFSFFLFFVAFLLWALCAIRFGFRSLSPYSPRTLIHNVVPSLSLCQQLIYPHYIPISSRPFIAHTHTYASVFCSLVSIHSTFTHTLAHTPKRMCSSCLFHASLCDALLQLYATLMLTAAHMRDRNSQCNALMLYSNQFTLCLVLPVTHALGVVVGCVCAESRMNGNLR